MQIRTFLKEIGLSSDAGSALKRRIGKTDLMSAREILDDSATFRRNVDLVSDMLSAGKKTLLFCGAGLSTPSGIPDYRSGYDTKLKTGPGKWEREKHENKPYEKPITVRRSVEAWPNGGHLALKALESSGLIHHFVSQNVDGLLSRAGIPSEKLSELHGNIYKEQCLSCGTVYWRDFTTIKKDERRITERRCLCTENRKGETIEVEREEDKLRGADIRVSLIYFGDKLVPSILNRSYEATEESDVCFTIGSSLSVNPAANIVRQFIVNGKKVIILNLQETKMHSQKTVNIHSYCDEFLEAVVTNLGIPKASPTIFRTLRLELIANSEELELNFYDFENQRVDSASSIHTKDSTSGEMTSFKNYRPRISAQQLLQSSLEIEFHIENGVTKHQISASDIKRLLPSQLIDDGDLSGHGNNGCKFEWIYDHNKGLSFSNNVIV